MRYFVTWHAGERVYYVRDKEQRRSSGYDGECQPIAATESGADANFIAASMNRGDTLEQCVFAIAAVGDYREVL